MLKQAKRTASRVSRFDRTPPMIVLRLRQEVSDVIGRAYWIEVVKYLFLTFWAVGTEMRS